MKMWRFKKYIHILYQKTRALTKTEGIPSMKSLQIKFIEKLCFGKSVQLLSVCIPMFKNIFFDVSGCSEMVSGCRPQL